MSIRTFLELHYAPEHVADGPAVLAAVLADTRQFPGCISLEVLTDIDDPSHVVVIEEWESIEADQAYRDWRAGDGKSNLGTVLAQAGTKTVYELTSRI